MNPSDTRTEHQLVGNAKDMAPADIVCLLNQIQSNFADLGPRLHDGITEAIENASDITTETKAEVLARLLPSGLEPQQQYMDLVQSASEGQIAIGHDTLTAQSIASPEWAEEQKTQNFFEHEQETEQQTTFPEAPDADDMELD
jgi:hypothetical protein